MDSLGFRLFWTWKDLLPKNPYVFSPLRLRAFSDSLNIVTSLVLSLLHSLRFLVRSRASLYLEVIALRHQLAVLNRSRPRPRLTSADRMFWAWLSHAWRDWRSALHIVKPDTVIGWHRRSFRLFWTWKSRQRTGRPGVPADVRALIRELSTANPLWGAPRIHGELQKLGMAVSQSTVAKYMRRHPRPPSQTWRTFLTNHAHQIMAADLVVVPTVTFRLLFVLVILAVDGSSTWPSPSTRLRPGHSSCETRFRQTRRLDISCMIAMPSSQRSRAPSPAWAFRRFVPRRDHHGRTGTWSASSARSDVNASITSSSRTRSVCTACSQTTSRLHARAHTSRARQRLAHLAAVMPPSAGRIVATPHVGGLHHHYDRVAA